MRKVQPNIQQPAVARQLVYGSMKAQIRRDNFLDALFFGNPFHGRYAELQSADYFSAPIFY